MQLRSLQPLQQGVSTFPANLPSRVKPGPEWPCQPLPMPPWQLSRPRWAVV